MVTLKNELSLYKTLFNLPNLNSIVDLRRISTSFAEQTLFTHVYEADWPRINKWNVINGEVRPAVHESGLSACRSHLKITKRSKMALSFRLRLSGQNFIGWAAESESWSESDSYAQSDSSSEFQSHELRRTRSCRRMNYFDSLNDLMRTFRFATQPLQSSHL